MAYSVVSVTWNVGNKECHDEELPNVEKLQWMMNYVKKQDADILTLGLQEVHPNHLTTWGETVMKALTEAGGDYALAGGRHAQTYFPVFVFQKKSTNTDSFSSQNPAPDASSAQETACRYDEREDPITKANMAAKGCCVANFTAKDPAKPELNVRVINCHLRHAYTGLPIRVQQQTDIERELVDPFLAEKLDGLIIQCGDLNYRLIANCEVTKEPTKKDRDGGEGFRENFDEMVKVCESGGGPATFFPERDQLQQVKTKGEGYKNFNELPVTFAPTYKRVASTDTANPHAVVYDKSEPRLPGWCDRVLWASGSKMQVDAISYECPEEVTWTDHRPVVLCMKATPA